MKLRCGKFQLDLAARPLVMGIVNLTPDSFSGDGTGRDVGRAVAHAEAQLAAGADILDLGAESTRPGSPPTPLQEELDRLLPVVEALKGCGVPLSIDTYKPDVMRASLAAGADLINDIAGLRYPGVLEAVAASDCGVCIMHMQGEPGTMQANPSYADVAEEVRGYLLARAAAAVAAGVARERLILDPGFGFGKTVAHNTALFRTLPHLVADGIPVLVGVSRKSMLGALTGRDVADRLPASLAAAVVAAEAGAAIIRVHDVAATRDALTVWQALRRE